MRDLQPPQLLLDTRRNLHFFGRAAFIFGTYKAAQAKIRVESMLTGADRDALWSGVHDWGGKQLYRMAIDMKGFHLKGAQWLGARPDIVPIEWCTHLGKLQDRCPQMPLSQATSIVEDELGMPLDAAFATFDPEPIGSASIAQVHRAILAPRRKWLRSWRPRRVAVKIQRPDAEHRMLADLKNIRAFFSIGVVRGSLAWEPSLILDQVEAETELEFRFDAEARTMDAVHKIMCHRPPGIRRWLLAPMPYRPPLRVPRSVQGMVSSRVLVMDLLPGTQLSRLAADGAPPADADDGQRAWRGLSDAQRRAASKRLLTALGHAYGRMLFEGGVVHADPHPGNLLLGPDRLAGVRVGLVDWGQTKEYDLSVRLRLAAVVDALCAGGDAAGRAKSRRILPSYARLGVAWRSDAPLAEQHAAAAAVATEWFDTTPLPPQYSPDPSSKDYVGLALGELTCFPVELMYFLRATQFMRALTQKLGVEYSMAEVWRPHARRLLVRRGWGPWNRRNWVPSLAPVSMPPR